MSGSGTKTLIIFNVEVNDSMKIIKSLEKSVVAFFFDKKVLPIQIKIKQKNKGRVFKHVIRYIR